MEEKNAIYLFSSVTCNDTNILLSFLTEVLIILPFNVVTLIKICEIQFTEIQYSIPNTYILYVLILHPGLQVHCLIGGSMSIALMMNGSTFKCAILDHSVKYCMKVVLAFDAI